MSPSTWSWNKEKTWHMKSKVERMKAKLKGMKSWVGEKQKNTKEVKCKIN
jgi:hypothetical protein